MSSKSISAPLDIKFPRSGLAQLPGWITTSTWYNWGYHLSWKYIMFSRLYKILKMLSYKVTEKFKITNVIYFDSLKFIVETFTVYLATYSIKSWFLILEFSYCNFVDISALRKVSWIRIQVCCYHTTDVPKFPRLPIYAKNLNKSVLESPWYELLDLSSVEY